VWYQWTSDTPTDFTPGEPVVVNGEDWTNWNSGTYRVIEGDFSTPYVDKRRERVKYRREECRRTRQLRKMRAREAMHQLELRKAEEKAQELLLDLIGPAQMEVYKQTGRVFVKGTKFDWLMQTEGSRCRLTKLKKDQVHDICIHIDNDKIPKTDQVIGYLLHAKHNENHLDKTGNLINTYDRMTLRDRIKEAANA
jgi:hypothetical protein